MRHATLLTGPLLALALLAAACGAAPEGEPGEAPGDAAPAPATSLEMTVWPEGEAAGDEIAYTLTCGPAGGDHPDPEGACAALGELGAEAFAPVPADAICTQQYGGPMEAHVRGVVDGEPVDARLAYHDGCEIARWDRLEIVVPRPEGAIR